MFYSPRLLVTGSAGYLGRLLIPALLERLPETQVIGLDRVDDPFSHPRYQARRLDLAAPAPDELRAALEGVDTVIHLAFQMTPRPGEPLDGGHLAAQTRFLEAVAGTARHLLVASAIAAYGFAPGRDVERGMLDENTPMTPGAGVAYADQKQALERLLDGLEAREGLRVVRIRPTNVGGPGIDPRRVPQLAGAVMLAPQTAHPLRQQVLHEEDWVSAVLTLLEAPAGAYNVGPDDWMTLEEAARLLGQRYVRLPGWLLRGLVEVAWRSGQSLFDASWLAFLEHPPIIVSNAKLRGLGWAPRHRTAEVLEAVAVRVRG